MSAPEPADGSLPPTSQIVRILTEFLEELEAGASLDSEKLAAQCPEVAAPLKGCLASLKFLHDAVSEQGRLNLPGKADLSEGKDGLSDGARLSEVGRFGDFRLVREVGRGGMGVVYEAEQISLGRRVALKILPFAATLNARQLQRFKNEAQAAACLHHTNIVPVFGIGCEHGVHYYSMQYIDGQTLAAVIAELQKDPRPKEFTSTLDEGQQPTQFSTVDPRPSVLGPRSSMLDPRSSFFKMVACLGIQAAEALDHAHQLGVVHRDIKPANLLLEIVPGVDTLRGEPRAFTTGVRLWITDFGLARLTSSCGGDDGNLTLTGDLVGTIRYMSPEQTQGRPLGVDHRTDIYSLGVTLYELLTLRPAFSSSDRHELLHQILSEEPTRPRRSNPAIPPELETIVLKAMAKGPAERYATGRELAADLERFLKDEPIRARRPTPLQRARKWARRHKPIVWSAIVALLATLAGLAGSAGWVMRDRAARQTQIENAVEIAVQDARQFQMEGKWPEAQTSASRASDLLKDGQWPGLAERVHALLADCRLVTRLEEIRLLQADVDAKKNRFALDRALPEYRKAFKEYGLDFSTMSTMEAAALLQARAPAVHATLVVALEDWLDLARKGKDREADWLEEVVSLADLDPWRQALRTARKSQDRLALERLAREVDVRAQPPQVLILLDRALRVCDMKEGAVALLKRAREAFPGDFWINQNLGEVLQGYQPPQYEEAIRYLSTAEALRPQSPGVRLNLGLALYKKGRLDEAIAALRQAIALKPDYVAALNQLGNIFEEKGELNEAMAVFRNALKVNPDDLEAQWNLGVVHVRMGQNEEALAIYDHILALQPDFIETHFGHAAQLSLKSWHDQAVASLRKPTDQKRHNGVNAESPPKKEQKGER